MNKKLSKEEILSKMDEMLKDSQLTEEDALEIGRKIKHEVAKKHYRSNDESQ